VTDVVMAEDEGGRSRGFGHVTFATRESLLKSLQADGVKLENRAIKVDIDRKGQRDKSQGGFGDRGSERRYRDEAPIGKSEAGGSWDRAAPRAAPQGADGGYQAAGGNRDARSPREGGGMRRGDRPAGDAADSTGAPATRPTIKIAPRTKPLEEVAGVSTASSSIFGEAKPRDASVFDKTIAAASDKPGRKERKNSEGGAAGENSKEKKEIVFKKKGGKEGDKDKEGKKTDSTPIMRGQAITARKEGTANAASGNKDGKKKEFVNKPEVKPKAASVPKVSYIHPGICHMRCDAMTCVLLC